MITSKAVYPILGSATTWLTLGLMIVGIITSVIIPLFAEEGPGLVIGMITAGALFSIGVVSFSLHLYKLLKRRGEILRIDKILYTLKPKYVVYKAEKELGSLLSDVKVFIAELPTEYINALAYDLEEHTGGYIELGRMANISIVTFRRVGTIISKGKLYHGLCHGRYAEIEWSENPLTVRSLIRHEMGHMILKNNKYLWDHHEVLGKTDGLRADWKKE